MDDFGHKKKTGDRLAAAFAGRPCKSHVRRLSGEHLKGLLYEPARARHDRPCRPSAHDHCICADTGKGGRQPVAIQAGAADLLRRRGRRPPRVGEPHTLRPGLRDLDAREVTGHIRQKVVGGVCLLIAA